ncbi:MAG: hypothetical protein LBJ01_03485 [Tannerella sp.]|nr:hypothetical protein [Tannerella sp.]
MLEIYFPKIPFPSGRNGWIEFPKNTPVSPRDKLVSPRDKLVSPRDKLVSHRDKLVSPRDKLVSLRDTRVSHRDKLVSPRDKRVSLRDKRVSPRDKLVSGKIKPRYGDSEGHRNAADLLFFSHFAVCRAGIRGSGSRGLGELEAAVAAGRPAGAFALFMQFVMYIQIL